MDISDRLYIHRLESTVKGSPSTTFIYQSAGLAALIGLLIVATVWIITNHYFWCDGTEDIYTILLGRAV